MEPRSFVTKKTTLTPERIRAVLRDNIGEIQHLQPLAEGEESQAFGFVGEGQSYVVRIHRGDTGFRKDQFAWRHFAGPGLPVPEVLRILALEEGLYACISRRAPGITLQDLDRASLLQVMDPVARTMEAIAGAAVTAAGGFGTLDAGGRGGDSSWGGFLTAIADRGRYDWGFASRYVAMDPVERLLSRVCELSAACPEQRKLVHGDFGSNNVLTLEGKITGVIDWSESLLGDPLYEAANIFFWRSWLLCMKMQAEYLEPQVAALPRGRERLLCYQLRIGLEEVYRNAMAGDGRRADWALRRCREIDHR